MSKKCKCGTTFSVWSPWNMWIELWSGWSGRRWIFQFENTIDRHLKASSCYKTFSGNAPSGTGQGPLLLKTFSPTSSSIPHPLTGEDSEKQFPFQMCQSAYMSGALVICESCWSEPGTAPGTARLVWVCSTSTLTPTKQQQPNHSVPSSFLISITPKNFYWHFANATPRRTATSKTDFMAQQILENIIIMQVNICLPNGSIRGKSSAASVGMTMNNKTSDDIRKCGDLCWRWCCKCSSMQL